MNRHRIVAISLGICEALCIAIFCLAMLTFAALVVS